MRKILYILLFFFSLQGYSQISYTGCSGISAGGLYPVTLNQTSMVGARNTFTSGNLGSCSAGGACAFQIIWTGMQWEIQFSSNGGLSYPLVLYTNSSASTPNPPDLTLGTWVDVTGSCGAIATLSGDVQSTLSPGLPIELLSFEVKRLNAE